jgi:catechol 2,3-dioxygenase-like lactoylglutathione lyase family enzyme
MSHSSIKINGLGAATPVLRIFDVAKAREFYLGFLGFRVDWEHRFAEGLPLYLALSQGACILHLSEHHADACPGTRLRIPCTQLDAYQRTLLDQDYGYARPGIDEQPWGREMTIADPFGNRLTFFDANEAA